MAAARDELNRINVFPVPDGDTGTNMCLTLRAVATALRDLTGRDGAAPLPLPYVAETMAQASVRGARGNSGMMLSQFLIGFRDGIGDRLRVSARELATAIGVGFERLRSSLDEPMEGTILTVAREAADEAGKAGGESDLRIFMSRIVQRAETAGLVERSPSKEDGRVVYLSLTPLGGRKLSAVHEALGPERAQLQRVVDELRET